MSVITDSPQVEVIEKIFRSQKERSQLLRAEPVAERRRRIRKLYDWIFAHREDIRQAVNKDFNKPLLEVDTSEIYPVVTEIRHTLENLNRWVAPTKIDAPLSYLGTRSEVRYEPKGVCLILSPWNFPFNLCIGPLVSCLAAGNTAILKPSELTPGTSGLISKMVSEVFEEDVVTVIEGGQQTASQLLSLPFDHIFFTGSPAIGKIVMQAAAANLTSVTLELGGKSPTIIDSTANIEDAARRIAFGKFLNNGQTCIAPDYVLIEEKIQERFAASLKKWVLKLFGNNGEITESTEHYSRIVNDRHFSRIDALIQDAIKHGAIVDSYGTANAKERFMPPVVLTNVSGGSRIMEEEIFGPVLPILTFQDQKEVVQFINTKPKPLALYIFSKSSTFRESILRQTSAGSVCINDCVLQFTHPSLPFGGVNNSGIGKSHGHYGFLTFSNEKPVLKQKTGFSGAYLLYPPYTSAMKRIINVLLKWF